MMSKKNEDGKDLEKAGKDLEKAAIKVLLDCKQILEERGKKHGNVTLINKGPFTGNPPEEVLSHLIDLKLLRIQNDFQQNKLPREDNIKDLINYVALLYALLIANRPNK